jgi:3-deoxy-7-phosphoheptulonate synthase
MALAAVAAGADGLIMEVHNDPPRALSDGPQSIRPEVFDALTKKLFALHSFMRENSQG